MTGWRRNGAALLLSAFAAGMAAGAALAQSGATDADAGRTTFLEACAGCHGADARGGGPTAALLTVKVPDLTQLGARMDGGYDPARVVQIVDGRVGLAAHGGPMPMFGGLLTGPSAVVDGSDGAPVMTTEPILAIARWLETVQGETR